ncbi:hypothetical protein BDN70DRAFT_901243 [Pholiota conissans]|uniref:Uncharacterized protein n=1 Tax=Pholiota conissans TaxID=109636 RepID=A0A9P5YPG7_9AGAR|nr:hypothetical protein BDN70DRAFT_901243 [Pholiota conissans]
MQNCRAFCGHYPGLTSADDDMFSASIFLAEYPPCVPPITDAEMLYHVAEPVPAECLSGYNLEAFTPYLASESTTQWTGIDSNSLYASTSDSASQVQSQGPGQGMGTNLASTSANTDLKQSKVMAPTPGPNFNSLPDSTPRSIAKVKHAFEQNSLTLNPSSDLDIIIQQFKPQVSTTAIRRECDLKKKDATSTGKFRRWSADLAGAVAAEIIILIRLLTAMSMGARLDGVLFDRAG